MMAVSGIKQSGSKLVPHSDFRAGTISGSVIEKYNTKCRISRVGAWNVRTMKQLGKLDNLKQEMDRLRLDLVGISEVRWSGIGDFWSGEYRVIHTGAREGNSGVGIVMRKEIGKSVESYLHQSDRILFIRLNTKPLKTSIIHSRCL